MPAGWIYAFSSVEGNSHIGRGVPCQDACGIERHDHYIIAVVADGAGSCKNSHIGSGRVVDTCLPLFRETVEKNNWSKNNIPGSDEWHHAAKNCLRDAKDDLEKFALESEMDFRSLSCTVIVVIAFADCLLMTHIGDGRAGYCDNTSNWFPLMLPARGELANQTVFITSAIWDDLEDVYIESRVITGEVKAFCLLTDGCEKAAFECNLYDEAKDVFYDPNRPYPLFFNPNIKILTELFDKGYSQQDVNELWTKFLTDGNERLKTEADDKTMILAVWLP